MMYSNQPSKQARRQISLLLTSYGGARLGLPQLLYYQFSLKEGYTKGLAEGSEPACGIALVYTYS